MTPVRLLESRVIDQIAAGEVVERPASVVKELVENALDAGARSIDVTLKDGGRTLVRVADDGAGMGRQDAMLAIERHATSKIRDVEDLASVRTLGFRGEALPSIAAVSRFELVTRPRDDDAGTRIRIDAGVLTDVRTVGAAPGTVVEVRTLFHTLPARKAFLRSAGTELGHAVEVVTRAALVRPDVAFVLRHEDRVLVRAQGGTTLATRATTLLGLDATIPVEVGRGELHLVGVAAGPTVHRPSIGTAVYLYVGGRWVRDPLLRRAVAAAYRDLIPPGRHPVVVLDLRVPDGAVDVNVHPTKAEVRFRDPAGIAVFVGDGLRDAIRSDPRRAGAHRATDPGSPILPFQVEVPAPPTPRIAALPPELAADRMGPVPLDRPGALVLRPGADDVERGEPAPDAGSVAAEAPPPAFAPEPPRIVGTARGRWIVVEQADGIAVIDGGRLGWQVRLHRGAGDPQRLLIPVRVGLSADALGRLDALADALGDVGLVAARFSGTEAVVRAVPSAVADLSAGDVLRVALAVGADPQAWADRLPPAPVTDDLVAQALAIGIPLPMVARVTLEGR